MPSRLTNGHSEIASKKRKRSELSSKLVPKSGKSSTLLRKVKNSDKSLRKAPTEAEEDDEDASIDDEVAEKQAEIMQMEQDIIASSENYNHIVKLLEYVEGTEEEITMTAAVALCRTFIRLMNKGRLKRKRNDNVNEVQVVKWLKDRYVDSLTALGKLLNLGEGTALTLSMRLLKEDSQHMGPSEDAYFPQQSFNLVVKNILTSANSFIVADFEKQSINKFADLRFEFLKTTALIATEVSIEDKIFTENLFTILYSIKDFPASDEQLSELDFYLGKPITTKKPPVLHLSAHKRHFQESWLTLLRRPIDTHRKEVLTIMTTRIIPHFSKPQLLMDFLTNCYDSGGVSSLLALNGLFTLMQTKNLDYPNFFPKLYALFDRNLMHVHHRSRFFRLVDLFLSSTHLPAVLVASFIKRMCRLCMSAPPAAIVTVIPLVYNLLRLHPSCTFMIHRVLKRTGEDGALIRDGFADPFDENEEDPMKTGALESSLWELETLRGHYHPNVATLANIISEQFTKQQYSIEDFLDHTYASMFDAEMTKRITKDPVIEYVVPTKIFFAQASQDENTESRETDLLKIWDFS